MSRFDSRLLFVIVSFGLLVIALSCSQTDNVTAPKSLTKVWLTARLLPTPPTGMSYGLWVSKVAYPAIADASEVRLLGQFSYISSDTLVGFLEPDNTVRTDTNEFKLDGDLFDYSYMYITIEDMANIQSLPGPVMLMQPVTGYSDTIRMYFPQHDSLFESIIRCNFESPTDGNRGFDGYGLWFCNYELIQREIHDTMDAEVTYGWDTIQPVTGDDGDTLNFADLYREYADSVWFEFDTSLVDFGQDSLALSLDEYVHYGATRKVDYVADSTIPRIIKDFSGTNITLDTTVTPVLLDVFTQDMYALPDLSPYGWKYKGWVVSNNIPTNAIGTFSPPAWDFISGELLIPGYQGGLLTTGTFSNEMVSDDANPFTFEIEWAVDSGTFIDTVLKRPNFPGEDFLDPAALSAATHGVIASAFNLLPDFDNSQSGTVFVTIEPINMVSDTTNFPLIAFCRQFPGFWPVLPIGGAGSWTLQNWTGSASGANGFPKITAEIKRL